jgi:hypothetical protein
MGFVLSSILSVLTAQAVVFVKAQPITPATPFGQLTPQQSQQPQAEQQQPITAGTPFAQPAQGDQQQAQTQQSPLQGLQGQQPQQQTPTEQDIVLLSARLNDDGFGGQQIVGEVRNNGTESASLFNRLQHSGMHRV